MTPPPWRNVTIMQEFEEFWTNYLDRNPANRTSRDLAEALFFTGAASGALLMQDAKTRDARKRIIQEFRSWAEKRLTS